MPTTAVLSLVPSLSGLVTIGTISSASSSSISIPVAQGYRLLMVFSITDGPSPATVTGNASAGLSISL